MMDIENYIKDAGFTVHDLDIGTSGLCAMFALALYHRFRGYDRRFVFVVSYDDQGLPVKDTTGAFYWRHVAMKIDGYYYDIEGLQKREWLIDNYGWGYPRGSAGLLEIDHSEFLQQICELPSAVDVRYFLRWKNMLPPVNERVMHDA